MRIREPQGKAEFEEYYDLRWRILRRPWKQPKGSEKDELEGESIHIMAWEGKNPVGVGRVHFNSPEEAQIRYMAVEEGHKNKGIGTAILKCLEEKAHEKGAKRIVLNSREGAVRFYKKNCYSVAEKAHTLFGVIPHFKMLKDLQKKKEEKRVHRTR